MKESCPVNKAGKGLWQLLSCCYTLITGRRQSIKAATSHMLKAVNMDFPCDPAGWCCALLSQWVSHWEIQWFNNHFSHLPNSSVLDSVQMWFKCFVCGNVSGLSDICCWASTPFPHAHYLAESHCISFPIKLSLSGCIFGNMYNSTHNGRLLSYVSFTSLWFLLQFQLWRDTATNFYWYY